MKAPFTLPPITISPVARRDVAGAVVLAAAVLVLVFVVEHVRDGNRDKELEQLQGMIAQDSSVRVAAIARTDTAVIRADSAVRVTQKAESGWARARAAAARALAIAASSKPDTVKVQELVATVDTLRIAGDSLEHAAAADTVAIAQLRASIIDERGSWATERKDLRHALEVSEKRHRHWGLGVTIGPTLVRDPAGVVRGGPLGATLGLTYRW